MKKNKKQTKSQIAYDKTRKMIIAGEFSFGHSWSMRKLAEKFSMSVAPVLEAIRRLEQEGILIAHPQRGITINQLSMTQLSEANIIREGLEIQAIRLLCKKVNARIISKLMKQARKTDLAVEKGNLKESYVLDFELHQEIVQLCECQMLIDEYDKLSLVCMLSCEVLGYDHMNRTEKKQIPHTELIKAIETGNADKAEKIARVHIKSKAS